MRHYFHCNKAATHTLIEGIIEYVQRSSMKGEYPMFKNNRYMTRRIQLELPYQIQLVIWHLIDTMPGKKDYLQIFTLQPINENNKQVLKICHKQELPKYQNEIIIENIPQSQINKAKIYVIDDGSATVMMYDDEY